MENEQLLAESKSRYISFPGRFTPVSHYCRAPLGNGKLCQRQDRLKVTGQTQSDSTHIYICLWFLYCECVCVFELRLCFFQCPFHGQIVPRDQEGRPCRQEDRLREEQEERRKREEQPGEERHRHTLYSHRQQSKQKTASIRTDSNVGVAPLALKTYLS